MDVSRIKVSGLKCFSGPREVDLDLARPDGTAAGWTVLAGPGGSGKTTLLQAVALALGAHPAVAADRWLAAGHPGGAVELNGGATWRITGAVPRAERSGPLSARHRYFGPTRPPAAAPIRGAAAALVEDGLLPDGWRLDPAHTETPWVRRAGLALPLAELGDGVARLTALVTELAAVTRRTRPEDVDGVPTLPVRATVLIDDVDSHLHPVWQQRIGTWLTTHFPQVQFIVATHSPYVCQAADPGALIRLAGPDDEPAGPRLLGEDLHQRVLYGSGDDTALSELFGLTSAYSPAAEAERRLLVRLERKLYAGDASAAELAEYRELGAKLNSSLTARADEATARLLGRDR
ncbi:AAA family ATPase [Kitasatospora sp. NPDC048540]|uniref:AAA family ATPase n=1 Tax=unclassified Kitasatospora TaxID=2633591 RepID=UPI000539F0C5|nr:AAA family ATPase [Kitasatospora sp. MBT63]